jgi:hypothetical protein
VPFYAEISYGGCRYIDITMLCLVILRVLMVGFVMLRAAFDIVMLCLVILRLLMVSFVMLSVAIFIIMLCLVMLRIVVVSLIMLSVLVPLQERQEPSYLNRLLYVGSLRVSPDLIAWSFHQLVKSKS